MRHGIAPIAILAILVIGYSAVDLYAAKDEARFELVDRYGDRSAMEGITVRGTLGDILHRSEFEISMDGVRHHTELFDHHEYELSTPINRFDYGYSGQYWVRRNQLGRWVEIWKRGWGEVTVYTGFSVGGNKGREYGNPFEYGLASVGEKDYYVAPTSLHFTGIAAIFELPFGTNREVARQLATISMADNDAERSKGLEILGLEAVGDRLILVLKEDRTNLIIRSYDSTNVERFSEEVLSGTEEYVDQYEAIVDDDGTLHLIFESSANDQQVLTILSLYVGDDMTHMEDARLVIEEGHWHSRDHQLTLRRVDGKLVVVMTLDDRNEDTGPTWFREQTRFMIDVLQDGEVRYRGELLADQNDDFIYMLNSREGGYPVYYRTFDNLSIE